MQRAGSPLPIHLVVTILVQSLLYGAFFVVSVLNYWALVFRHSSDSHPRKTLLGLSSIMFILATLHIISSVTNALAGTESNSQTLLIFSYTICFSQMLVGNSIALYRCWTVFGRRRVFVTLPFILFLGSIAAGVGTLIDLTDFVQGSTTSVRPWFLAYVSSSLATSMICTLSIATRIWSLFSIKRGRSTIPFIPIILESGALYSVILALLLVLLATKSWFQYVLIEALPSIIGILFSIILIRISLGLSIDGPQPSSPSPSWSPSSTKPHYFKSSNSLNNYIPPSSSPSSNTSSHYRPLILPLILKQTPKAKTPIPIQQQQQQQQHYHLRSQLPQPSSYFRTSEDIEIDIELEFEINEARCRRPRSLPVNPRSKIYTIAL